VKSQTTVPPMILGALLLASNPAAADPFTCPVGSIQWTGNAGDGRWSNAANWSSHKVPGATSDVCIPTFGQADATPPISIHSMTVTEGGTLIILGKAGASFSVATSLTLPGFIEIYDGTNLSAGSIDMPNPGQISVYGNSTITSPAFSNTTGTLYVGVGGTLRLTDNPIQLQHGNLSGGNWNVDDTGVLILPSDISQITTQPGAAYWTVLDVQGSGSLQNTSGNSPLATLTSVGSDTVLSLQSLTLDHDLTSQGHLDVGSLTVRGTYTLASGASDDVGPSLSATSVIVESGATLATTGTVVSSITNNGTVSPGIVTVTGNYTQAAGATLSELFGYATLNVKQNATVSGALNVTFSPKRPPQSGAKYTALTFGSLSGSFTSHTAGFTLTTSGNSIQVTKQ
jgi:hypothetical protein